MGRLAEVSLSDLVEIAVGGLWGSETRTEKENMPVRVIRGVDAHKMSQREVVNLPIRWVSANQLASRTLGIGDVVLEASGACGRSYVVRKTDINGNQLPLSFSNFSRRLIPNSKVDPTYLGYRLKQAYESDEIASYVTGTAMPNLDVHSALAGISIPLPPLGQQREIASILGALDDKIELNRRMSTTLEAMARALFQSWFVDFDPVHAKAEGRQPVGMDAETAALFPDTFEDSVLGLIPKGWRTAAVKDIGDVVTGKTPSTADPRNFGDDVPFITIPDMHNKIFATSTARQLSTFGAQTQPNKCLPAGTLCVSCIATPGLVVITVEIAQTNQQINAVLPNSHEETYYWFWVLKNLGAEIASHGSGGSVLSNLSKGRFESLRVMKPPPRLMQEYSKIVKPVFEKIRAVALECESIAASRDTLLPKLLGGELRVGDVAV